MENTTGKALLIVAADPSSEWDHELNRWYNEEHLADELRRVPGVLSVRRFTASHDLQAEIFAARPRPEYYPKYLTIFELETEEVLHSKEYQEFLTNPTEWSRRVGSNVRITPLVYHQSYPEEGFFTRG